LDNACVNWTISPQNCGTPSSGRGGCDPNGLQCCDAATSTCVPLADDGTCTGFDYGDRWGYAPASAAAVKRDLASRATTLSGPACSGNHPLVGKPGVCISIASCHAKGGTTQAGLCPAYGNDILCCAGRGFTYNYQSAPGLCGDYAGKQVFNMIGNGGQSFTVTKILRNHLTNPSSYSLSATASDNTILVATACAFSKMRSAALKAGVTLTISSGFRTFARQQYFYHCYLCKCCNGGNLAAIPGTSNHGLGLALDLNTASPGVYNWLANHARTYGFIRTVPSELWHWEHRF